MNALTWTIAALATFLLAIGGVDLLLRRFYRWQDRKEAERNLTAAMQDIESVAARAWQDWDGQGVEA